MYLITYLESSDSNKFYSTEKELIKSKNASAEERDDNSLDSKKEGT